MCVRVSPRLGCWQCSARLSCDGGPARGAGWRQATPPKPLPSSPPSSTPGACMNRRRVAPRAHFSPVASPATDDWPRVSARLVDFAAAPFVLLPVPQLLLGLRALVSGDPEAIAALGIIPVGSVLSSLAGNALLLLRFSHRGETGASRLQLLGLAGNLAILMEASLVGQPPRHCRYVVYLPCSARR